MLFRIKAPPGSLYYTGPDSCFFVSSRAGACGAALKHPSARQGLASKTVEQERTEETEVSPLSLFAPVLQVRLRLCRARISGSKLSLRGLFVDHLIKHKLFGDPDPLDRELVIE